MPFSVLITFIKLLCFGILVEGKRSAWAESSIAPRHFAVVPLATGGSTTYAVLPLVGAVATSGCVESFVCPLAIRGSTTASNGSMRFFRSSAA